MKRSGWVIALALVALLACGAPPSSEVPAGKAELRLDDHAIATLELPKLHREPFVVVEARGDDGTPKLLVEADADHFVVFDGISRKRYETPPASVKVDESIDAEVEAPPRYVVLEEGAVAPRATHLRDAMRLLFIAHALESRGATSAAREVLDVVARTPAELSNVVTEVAASRALTAACEHYAAGGTLEDYARGLARAGAFQDASAGRMARFYLAALKRSSSPPSSSESPLDALIRRRIEGLRDVRCNLQMVDRGPVTQLGRTALPALEAAKDDGRPTRCFSDGGHALDDAGSGGGICEIDPSACPSPIGRGHVVVARPRTLLTIGDFAKRAQRELQRSPGPFDATDIECDAWQGSDAEAEALVDRTLASGDASTAIAIVGAAKARLRASLVARLAAASTDPAVARFLADEAAAGPVLLARARAADAARAKLGDVRWAQLSGEAADLALRTPPHDGLRCDQSDVLAHWQKALDAQAAVAVQPILVAFASYEPRAKIDVLMIVMRRQNPPKTLIANALGDLRTADTVDISFTVGSPRPVRPRVYAPPHVACHHPSPSDIAALLLMERLKMPYACGDPPEIKAEKVKTMLAMKDRW